MVMHTPGLRSNMKIRTQRKQDLKLNSDFNLTESIIHDKFSKIERTSL